MTEKEARIFIAELFHVVNTTSILIVDSTGVIHRLNCPFPVLAIMDVPPDIINGMRYRVEAVKMSLDLKDVFIINSHGYYIWGFLILLQ